MDVRLREVHSHQTAGTSCPASNSIISMLSHKYGMAIYSFSHIQDITSKNATKFNT